uniref:Ig-like domain-containing protein n=1 Tax=Oncorhynchus kisutch TaxID=8019 RepID=A0A8C7K190_ONCKI
IADYAVPHKHFFPALSFSFVPEFTEAVPKPTITYTCNSNKTSCILTSEGNATGAERVTYSWKVGEGAWEVIGKQLIVSKSDTGKSTNSYKYICKLKNSVSGEVSEPVGEVFGPEPSEIGGGVVVGVVFTIVALVAVITGKNSTSI